MKTEFDSAKMPELMNDSLIASLLSVSRGWVRKERYKRRKGFPHVLTIDPVQVGSRLPRYKRTDVIAWIESLN